MAFPEVPRVLYHKNPLVAVVLQLKFPTILRIDTELPAEFQDRVRAHYPIFEQTPAMKVVQPSSSSVPINVQFSIGGKVNNFVSADRRWTVSLTRDFLSITTNHYERWEDFKLHVKEPLQAFVDIYSPFNFSRVGLRYQDVIRRSALGLNNILWSSLLQPPIAGALSSANIELDVATTLAQISVHLDEASYVQINHGFVLQPETNEMCYLIDSDFSTTNATEPNHVTETLDAFNKQSRNLFKWCIKEQLHTAMEPQYL